MFNCWKKLVVQKVLCPIKLMENWVEGKTVTVKDTQTKGIATLLKEFEAKTIEEF